MVEPDDWRLTNQKSYLDNAQLIRCNFTLQSNRSDHEHCEFCFAKFSKEEKDLQEGFCTPDSYCWICNNCFDDFKEIFKWRVTEYRRNNQQ